MNSIYVYNKKEELVASDMETLAELLKGLGYKLLWEENDNEDTEKYEEICRALVGIDATERYTHEDILSYVYNLKKTEEKFYDNKK